MNNPLPRLLAVGIVAMFVSGVVVFITTETPAGALLVSTSGPDLISIEVVNDDVEYCFDETIDEDELDEEGEGFHLAGYDDDIEMEGDEAEVNMDEENCVTVTFDDDLDPFQTMVGYVDTGTVEKLGAGNSNVLSSAPVDETDAPPQAGSTAGPDLKDFEVNESTEKVTYEFDERLDSASDFTYQSSDFGVNQEGGDQYTGDSVTIDGDQAVVQFSENLNADTDRAFVDREAVGSQETQDNARNFGPARAEGEDTERPDLGKVERIEPDVFRFTFDESIDRGSADEEPEKFLVYGEDGTEYDGDSADPASDHVDVEFNDIEESLADFEIPLATVLDGAVEEGIGSDPNTLGSFALAESHELPGFTDAPDLQSATLSGSRIDLRFDEVVSTADASRFFLISKNGSLQDATVIGASGTGPTTIDAQEFALEAPADTASLAGVLAGRHAVVDYAENNNPPASVGISSSTSSPTTSASPSTTPAPSPSASATPPCELTTARLGTAGSDVLVGTPNADVICGLGGDDFVRGLGGSDIVLLGPGNDVTEGGGGSDRIRGGEGNDLIRGGSGNDRLFGNSGDDLLNGQTGRDLCRDRSGANRYRSCERT